MATEEHVEIETPENNTRKLNNSTLDFFGKLSNDQESIRLKSGTSLILQLSNADKPTEVKYALGRLLRGLGSTKNTTRQGYYTCLVALLNLNLVDINEFFEYFEKELHTGSGSTKSETADVSLGRILACGAVIRSKIWQILDIDDKKKCIELLIKSGKERDYLQLASYSFVIDLYNKITSEEFETVIFHLIKTEIAKSWQEHNLDTVYLLLKSHEVFPDSIKPKFIKNNLGNVDIICRENLKDLTAILMVLPRATSIKHPVYSTTVKALLKTDLIVDFLQELDQNLIKYNRNKFLTVVRIIVEILNGLEDFSIIPDLFNKNFLQNLINIFKTNVGKSKDKEFEEQCNILFNVLITKLKDEKVKDKIRLKVLKKLLFYPGVFIFEKITKSKLIQNITSTLTTDGVKKLAKLYRVVAGAEELRVVNDTQTEKWWNMDRIYAGYLIVKLLNHSAMHNENDWKVEQMLFFLNIGLFRNEDIGHELADSFRDIFYSSLDLKLSKLDDLCGILSKIVNYIDEKLNDTNYDKILYHPLTEDDYKIWNQTIAMIRKIENKKKKRVFHTLFLHLSLQLFHSNHTKLASDSLKELFSCYDRMKLKKSDENNSDPLWIEVIIDLFLNLLSHNSRLLRNSINCVFPHLCQFMTATAIHQILSVLDPKNEDNPLSKMDEDDDDEDDDNEESDSESNNEEEEDDDDDDDDDEDEEDDNINDKLKMALHQALSIDDNDADSVDLNEIDDETGEKLDKALAEAFKQFKPNLGRKSKKQNKDDQTLTHFRIRVLDLIEIYLNSNTNMYLVLEIMLPLLNCLEFCIRDDHQKSLQDRVKSCLKKLTSIRKFENTDEVTGDILIDLLKSLLEKGTKNSLLIQDMSEKLSDCCIFIIHCSQQLSEKHFTKRKKNPIVKVFKESLTTFFQKRDCLIPYALFKNILQQNWNGILELVPILFEFIFDESIRPFRRSQSLELLTIFFNNHRFINNNKEEVISALSESRQQFLLNCINFFHNFCEEPQSKSIREKYLCGLFRLLIVVKQLNNDNEENFVKLGELIRETRSYLTFSKDTRDSYKKLCRVLNIPNVVKMKPNTIKLGVVDKNDKDDDDENEEEKKEDANDNKKQKRKLDDNAKLLKKQSKKLRMQSLSEGFKEFERKFDKMKEIVDMDED